MDGRYTEPMSWKDLLSETVREWIDDSAAQHAAALAFYTMFSLAPLLVIAVSIAGMVFGDDAARGEVQGQISHYIGQAGAETVQQILRNAERPALSTLAGLGGLVVLLVGASGVFAQLKTSMDVMFDVPPDPDATWMSMIVERFFSFTMVLGTGFLLLVSLVISTLLTAAITYLGDLSGAAATLTMVANFVVGGAFTALLFAAIFRYVPTVRAPWSDVWPGAILTAVLFSLGRIVLGWYLAAGTVGSAYGAAGSLVVVLAWVYYSAQILFLGAEFTQVYGARRRGDAPGDSAATIETKPEPETDIEQPAPPPVETLAPQSPRREPGAGAQRRAARVKPTATTPAVSPRPYTAQSPHAAPGVPVVGLAALLGAVAALGVIGSRGTRHDARAPAPRL